MAERSEGCSGEVLAACARKKKLLRKMTEVNFWIVAEETIGMFGREMIGVALFTQVN